MRSLRLRTKFLLSLLAIIAGLTIATLLLVRHSVQGQVRQAALADLRNSINTYQSFEKQREITLTHSAELIADLPIVRALMTTRDARTIQDAIEGIWKLSGSELLILASPSGEIVALRTRSGGFEGGPAQKFLQRSIEKKFTKDWWQAGGHLYEVWIQPIYFGEKTANTVLGVLAVGHEIDEQAAKDFSKIAASEVAFLSGQTLVATTLNAGQRNEFRPNQASTAGEPQEILLGGTNYLMTSVNLFSQGEFPVSLNLMKSLDQSAAFVSVLNRVLAGLGLLSILAGSALVFLISDTFTRPLANLVNGVRALDSGDFNFPLQSSGGDEVAEVTSAFDRMRSNLQKTQTEQRQLEERLRQAHKMEAVGRLAGGVAHDFNNLLTVIRGHSDLLLDRYAENDPGRHGIEEIQKAAGRATSMTRQLLAFSRMQVLQPRVLDLNAVVADMGKMLPRLIGEHIEYQFQPEQSVAAIKADPGQVEQVIMNLAVNARDAMADGGKLSVAVRRVDINEAEASRRAPMVAGKYVLLSVTDTGHGMDEKTKVHIFEPFFTTKEVGKGTGLGLATVYGVVKQSGGFIWVESSPGHGATFEIYFPQTTEGITGVLPDSKQKPVPLGTETILVVEDEGGVRELACEFLRTSGYRIMEAKDGADALEVARAHSGPIHLVLSDMVMPRMGGAELVLRLKSLRPDVKVLFMTGYTEYAGEGIDPIYAHTAMLQKPFSITSLVEKVRETLHGK